MTPFHDSARGLLVSSVLALGCLPELVQVQGEHILYEHSDELHPCAGTAAYVDAVVPSLARQLAVPTPGPLRYAWLVDADVSALFTGRSKGGMRLSGQAIGWFSWGARPALIHEVAHLVAGTDVSAPFFSEGVAVAMDIIEDNGSGPRYVAFGAGDPRETMDAQSTVDVDYRAAGLFVTFILVRHGPERLREFYRALVRPFTMERIGAEFQRVYGVSLDSEVEVFVQGVPTCEPDHFELILSECTGARVEWEDERTWRLAETMSCDSPGVVVGVGPDRVWPSFHAVTLDVPTAGVYVLRNTTTGAERVRFGPCFGCPWDFKDVTVEANEKKPLPLAAGRYYVRVGGESDAVSDIDVSLHFAF